MKSTASFQDQQCTLPLSPAPKARGLKHPFSSKIKILNDKLR